jgi:hypothetical protein
MGAPNLPIIMELSVLSIMMGILGPPPLSITMDICGPPILFIKIDIY